MKTALVLGATAGIGLEIAKQLNDYLVIGVGRDINKVVDIPDNLKLISRDLSDVSEITKMFGQLKTDYSISCPDLIVFSAGEAFYGLHENIDSNDISSMVNTNLMCPMVVTSHYLSSMKQRKSGRLIYISSVTANHINPHGAAYGATKAGLSSFARSVFEEARKHNVKVNIIAPDLTETDLYRNADFAPVSDKSLKPVDIAEAVKFCINQNELVDVLEIVLRPQENAINKNK